MDADTVPTNPAGKSSSLSHSSRKLASQISLGVSITLMVVKFYAFRLTESQAIFSDALESIVNVVAALLALFVVQLASKPADQDHPYGHGKAEFFSQAFEGGLIAFAALLIVVQAAEALWRAEPLHQLTQGIVLTGVAGVINLALGLYLKRVGKKHHSAALTASGAHVISDFWTTAGVIAGLFLVMATDLYWLDPLVAIIVGFNLGWAGTRLVKSSFDNLMDAEDRDILKELREVFIKVRRAGIIRIHHTRVIRSGHYHHIDAHVVVPEFWDIKRAHDFTKEYEDAVIREYRTDGEIHFHVDPCRQAYCSVCDLDQCPVRRERFDSLPPFSIEELTDPEEPEEFASAHSPGEAR